MKRIIFIIFSATFFLWGGCTRDNSMDQNDVASGKGFRFEGNSGEMPVTRTTVVSGEDAMSLTWNDDDQVGIFGQASTGSIGYNCCYNVIPDTKNAANCTLYPEETSSMIPWVNDPSVSFYACYPYASVGNGALEAYPVSLPEQQIQSAGDNTEHVGKYSFMKAEPVTLSTTNGQGTAVNLNFHSIFSVVEISVKLSENSSIDVPVKELKMTAADGTALTIPAGTIDLTSPIVQDYTEIPVKADESLPTVRLLMNSAYTIKKGAMAKFYFVVAPGTHVDGNLSLEIIAIDNSKVTVTLPGEVTFKSNRRYRKSVEFTAADLVVPDPFEVTQTEFTVAVGQPVTFEFEGLADHIDFFSGEVGHDYQYSLKNRLTRAEAMKLSFSTQSNPSGNLNAFNPQYASISYSLDFNGTYDEENMEKATWTDISDNFTFPTEIKTATPSGEYDMVSLYPEDQDELYLRFSYAFTKGTNEIGRSIIIIKDFMIMAELTGQSPFQAYGQDADWQAILPVSNSGGAQVQIGTDDVRFTASSWKPSADGKAWLIVKIAVSEFDMGRDQSFLIKNDTDPQPASYTHTYSKPGVYSAVFVVKTNTLMGEKNEIKEVTVTVIE